MFRKNDISEITKKIVQAQYIGDKWNLFALRPIEIQKGQNDVLDLQNELKKLVEPIKERIGDYIVKSLQERLKTFCNREALEQMKVIGAPKDQDEHDYRPTIAAIISNESIKRFVDSVVGRVNYEIPGYDQKTVYLQTEKELKNAGFVHDKKMHKLKRI